MIFRHFFSTSNPIESVFADLEPFSIVVLEAANRPALICEHDLKLSMTNLMPVVDGRAESWAKGRGLSSVDNRKVNEYHLGCLLILHSCLKTCTES